VEHEVWGGGWRKEGVCGNPLLLATAAVYQADSFGDFVVPDVDRAHQTNNSKIMRQG
jgi:hypothetical protein